MHLRDDRPMVRVLVAALVVGLAGTAAADTESSQLFEEGRALAKDGKYEEACAKFARSLELDRAPGTLLNYADCHEHLGHLAQAWRLFDEAARASEKENNDERAKFARERAQALVPKTSTIVVKLAAPDTPGLVVSIGGRTATPAAEIREIVDPGEVAIEVSGSNLEPFKKTERAEPGLKIVVEVPKLAEIHDDGGGGSTTTERRRTRVIAAYSLGGLGAVSLVTGVVLGITAKNKYNAEFDNSNCMESGGVSLCNPEGYKNQGEAITRANIGTGFAAAGVVLVAAGAVVFFTAPRDTVVIPTASAGAGGLAVVGRF